MGLTINGKHFSDEQLSKFSETFQVECPKCGSAIMKIFRRLDRNEDDPSIQCLNCGEIGGLGDLEFNGSDLYNFLSEKLTPPSEE